MTHAGTRMGFPNAIHRVGGPLLAISLTTLMTASAWASAAQDFWPAWRGPAGTGAALQGNPPITWSESENVKWKVEIPGHGQSSPAIWGNRIFFQTAIDTGQAAGEAEPAQPPSPQAGARGARGGRGGQTPTTLHKFDLICLDRTTGRILWQKTACSSVEMGATGASSPATTPGRARPCTRGNPWRVSTRSMPPSSAWGIGCMSRPATAPSPCSRTPTPSRSWRPTSSTTGSTPPRPSSATSCTCEATGTSIASPGNSRTHGSNYTQPCQGRVRFFRLSSVSLRILVSSAISKSNMPASMKSAPFSKA
jgi:hypothetical protein